MMYDRRDPVYGTCFSMCPTSEIIFREKNKLLHPFERDPSSTKWKADESKMVKEYCRSAAGKHQSKAVNLRPASILIRTVNYLIEEISRRTDYSWQEVYNFIFDRLRAVRQDMVIQELKGECAVSILKICIRFHIYASYRLCMFHISEFDPHINDTHAQECMKRLLVHCSEDDIDTKTWSEFVSIYLLYNLNDLEAMSYGISIKKKFEGRTDYQVAIQMNLHALNNNYVKLFKLVEDLNALQLCAFHRQIPLIQTKALARMKVAYSNKTSKFPLTKLSQIVALKETDRLKVICENMTIKYTAEHVHFLNVPSEGEKISDVHYPVIDQVISEHDLSDLLQGKYV